MRQEAPHSGQRRPGIRAWRRAILILLLALAGIGAWLTLTTDLETWARRLDYAPRRVYAWWRGSQPHPQFVPTPILIVYIPTPQSLPPPASPASPTIHPLSPSATPARDEPSSPEGLDRTAHEAEISDLRPPPERPRRPPPAVKPAAPAVVLTGFRHEWQTWNNCGPATLAMALSGLGRPETQKEAARALKPDREDKNVSPEEMVAYVQGLGLGALARVNGDLDRLKLFLSNGFPVVVEMWHTPRPNDGMGHYRLVIGYDDAQGTFTTYDSLNGPNVRLEYQAFDADWRVFNRAYLVVYREEQADLIAAIVGDDLGDRAMYQAALTRAQAEAAADPTDAFAWFNAGSALVGLGRFPEAAEAYDRARVLGLPWRMLWYQFGPYQAYYAIGRYDDLLALTEATLHTAGNLEESHYYRGLALRGLGRFDEAQRAFATALKLNPNFAPAAEALASP